MTYEVELKFPLPDPRSVLLRLKELGATPESPVEQQDVYFAHPQRDFEQTDEALRIRQVADCGWLTYKGPVVDSQTKSRREIEIGIEEGRQGAEQLASALELLGFRPVRAVRKQRTGYRLNWQGRHCEVAFDRVEELGTYLEIETLAEETERDAARDVVLDLARQLGVSSPEKRSYLCLLLDKDRGQ